jgi:hypothetical protein
MDTSATGNSAPKSRIRFNAKIQVRENGLKSCWNFGLAGDIVWCNASPGYCRQYPGDALHHNAAKLWRLI